MTHGKPRDRRKELHQRRLDQLWKNSGITVRDFCACHRGVQEEAGASLVAKQVEDR
jgi:hypothetical protein